MYSDIITILKDLTIQQAIWGTLTGVSIVTAIASWIVIGCSHDSYNFSDRKVSFTVKYVIAISLTILFTISVITVTKASINKRYAIQEIVAPHVDRYIDENPQSVFNPQGALTTVDGITGTVVDIIENINEALSRTVDLIPAK